MKNGSKKCLINFFLHLETRKFDPNKNYWFFFSGGEPTYNPETLPLIRKIIDIVPHANIIISTNANTKPKVMDRYINTVREYKNVKWRFDCSIDDIGHRAEAIRYGLRWDVALENILRVFDEPNAEVRISPTVNMYSIPHMYDFVKFFYELFDSKGRVTPYMFNFNMVQEPELSPWSMPYKYSTLLTDAIEYCNKHGIYFGKHLENVQELIGTKIDEKTASLVEAKWNYFREKRPSMPWELLFPHVPQIIEELKHHEDPNIRKP